MTRKPIIIKRPSAAAGKPSAPLSKLSVVERFGVGEAAARASGADAIIKARMTGAGIQAKTAAGLTPATIEHVAITIGRDDCPRVERSEVRALFNRKACAVMRLWQDHQITDDGAFWAVRFAWAGDRVMGPARVRTGRYDDGAIAAASNCGAPQEKDAAARHIWDVSRIALGNRLFRILDLVMRHDMGAADAAREVMRQAHRAKATGMGDMALIEACDRLVETFTGPAHKRAHAPVNAR